MFCAGASREPCQDLSVAGKGAGLAGERSGLWSEYARLVGELRPRYVLVENVPGLLSRGMGTVLGNLAEMGFDAEWAVVPAAAVGAPHLRERVWIVAYPNGDGEHVVSVDAKVAGTSQAVANPDAKRRDGRPRVFGQGWWRQLEDRFGRAAKPGVRGVDDGLPAWMDTDRPPLLGGESRNRGSRNSALGNALVPQIAERIGWRGLEFEAASDRGVAA